MAPTPLSPRAAGWNVAAGFVCAMLVFGVPTMMMPVLYSPILDEFPEWTRAQLTAIVTIKFLAGSLCTMCFGYVIDRWGIRRAMTVAGAVVGLSMVAFLQIDSLAWFYLVGSTLGLGSLGVMVTTKVMVSQTFTRRQGFAVGLALLGTSVAGAFTPSLTNWLVSAFGWRGAVALMSLGVWLVALPFFLWNATNVGRESPPIPAEPVGPAPLALPPDAGANTFEEVLRSRSFWCMAAAVAVMGFVDQSLTQHVALYLERELKWQRGLVAHALGLIALVSIVGKVGFGWLMDRWSVRGVMACYLLMAVAVALMLFSAHGVMFFVFAVARGLAHGGSIVDVPVLAKHAFGPRVLGRTIGVLSTFLMLGFAAGPFVMSWLHDSLGSYRFGFGLLIGLSLVAALLAWAIKPAYWLSLLGGPGTGRRKPANRLEDGVVSNRSARPSETGSAGP